MIRGIIIPAIGGFIIQPYSRPASSVFIGDPLILVQGTFKSQFNGFLDLFIDCGIMVPDICFCLCKAKLLEGEVKMDVHWGLEEEEVANGFILTCQSHPVSEKVVVDFDIR